VTEPMADRPDTRELLLRVAAGDPTCADDVERLGHELIALAAGLRAGGGAMGDDRGGFGDSVAMKVIAPDGRVRQSIDTGERP